MKRIFSVLSSALFVIGVFAQDQFCIGLKDSSKVCFPIDEIDRMYMEKDMFTPSGSENGHDYVDLGLPSGLLWATADLGAASIKKLGDYYAWAEIDTFETWSGYTHDSLKYYKNGEEKSGYTKYTTSLYYNSVPDSILTLLAEDDAASVKWGSNWKIPTQEEWQELFDNCTWEGITSPDALLPYSEHGTAYPSYSLVGTSKINGAKIFLVGGGTILCGSLYMSTKYWTSNLDESNDHNAIQVAFTYKSMTEASGFDFFSDIRCIGCAIRPVFEVK